MESPINANLNASVSYSREVKKNDPNKLKKDDKCVKVKKNKWLCTKSDGSKELCDVKKEKCKKVSPPLKYPKE